MYDPPQTTPTELVPGCSVVNRLMLVSLQIAVDLGYTLPMKDLQRRYLRLRR